MTSDTQAYRRAEEQLERQLTAGERLACTILNLDEWTVKELSDASGVALSPTYSFANALEAGGVIERISDYPVTYRRS